MPSPIFANIQMACKLFGRNIYLLGVILIGLRLRKESGTSPQRNQCVQGNDLLCDMDRRGFHVGDMEGGTRILVSGSKGDYIEELAQTEDSDMTTD